MNKKIGKIEEAKISALLSKGISNREIARKLNLSESGIRNFLKRSNIKRSSLNLGRPRILTSREQNRIEREFTSGNIQTKSEGVTFVKKITEKAVSRRLIGRILKEKDFKCYNKKQKPFISKKNLKERKVFYEKHKNFTFQNFLNYTFSDESTFELFKGSGGNTFYKKRNAPTQPNCVKRTEKFGKGKLMVWGFISKIGKLHICKVDGSVNTNKYINILEEFFLDKMQEDGLNVGDIIFQQDNASCHVSVKAKNWFFEQNITLLKWPAQSPDMNPIENLWEILDKAVRLRKNEIHNLDDLWRILLEESKKIDPNVIKKLYKSMPKRIKALKKANYDVTKY